MTTTEGLNMQTLINHEAWAREVFGHSQLGDRRRTDRLVAYAARQAAHAAASTNAVCQGDSAAAEGAYRFLRNAEVAAQEIAESGFQHAVALGDEAQVVLAIQDSTTLGYAHSVREELGDLGGKARSKRKGFWVHSTLAVDGVSGAVYGLLDQQWWVRQGPRRQRGAHKKLPYEEKESFKWQGATERVAERLPDMGRVVMVCDREADVHEYLEFLTARGYRYVVRAERDRRVDTELGRLWETLHAQPLAGRAKVAIAQKGGRPARTARVEVRYASVELRPTTEVKRRGPVKLQVVLVSEPRPPATVPAGGALEWMLLTSEAITSLADAQRVVEWYKRRWVIEDFHKAWKTGCGAEERRFRSADNLRRALSILAFVAVRLLQLRSLAERAPGTPCDKVLSRAQWVCLWLLSWDTKGRPLPAQAPPVRWAVEKIANLGGWIKSKQTMAIGWQTLWRGWQQLDAHVAGFLVAQVLNHEK